MNRPFTSIRLWALVMTLFFSSGQLAGQKQLKIGKEAPEITITEWLLNIPADTSLEQKYIVLDFWATWCKPCLAAVPHLNDLQSKFDREDLHFLSITDEAPEIARKVFDRVDFHAIVVTDEYGETHKKFGDGRTGLAYYPLIVLIDKNNIIRWYGDPEALNAEMLARFIEDQPLAEADKTAGDPDLQEKPPYRESLPELVTLSLFSDLFEDDRVDWIVHLKELPVIPDEKPRSIFFQGTNSGFANYITLDQLFQTLFPYERFVFPPGYEQRIYNFAHIDKAINSTSDQNLKATLYRTLGLKAEEKIEANTKYRISINDKSLLVPDHSSEMTGQREQQPGMLAFTKYSIEGLLQRLAVETDSDWNYRGKDKEKYSFEILMYSEETIIKSLEAYGLKVRPVEGKILTTYFEE